jgi:hypothetical protein
VAVVGRSNGDFKLTKSLLATLTLDPLTADPELVGREIRNRLDEAGIRESHCAVCIPLPWVLTLQVKIPEMPEADVSSFLMLEAERGLPYAPADLSLSVSRYKTAKGEACATLVAVPLSHVQRLEKALRLAKLKPVSFSLGISILAARENGDTSGGVTIAVGEHTVELLVASGEGVVTMRALEGAIDGEGAQRRVDAEVIGRELRITLGQLAKPTRDTIRQAQVIGGADIIRPMIEKLTPACQSLDLTVATMANARLDMLKTAGLPGFSGAAAFGLAARILSQTAPFFEFMPPKPSRWHQTIARFGSRKIVSAGMAAAAVVLILSGAFLWQFWELRSLESRWHAIQPRIAVLEEIQRQMRQYRAWYDESFPAMRILKKLVETFPEDGSVSVKSLQIKDLSEVTFAGQARDNKPFLALLDQMMASRQLSDVKPLQVRGTAPKQFSFSFRWNEGGKNED